MYTLGNEFTLNNLNYIGKYNIGPDGKYYTELFFMFGVSKLLKIKSGVSISLFKYTLYGKLFIKQNDKFYNKYKFIYIQPHYVVPTEKDYLNKKLTRYFVYIQFTNQVKEVSKTTFNDVTNLECKLYITDLITWLISGNIQYVYQENKKLIENSKIILLYKYITDYTQFYKQ